jgi:DnaJ-domain-containing protein 1
MVLDHDSGDMSGEILEGTFAGRELAQLDEAELIALWRECRATDGQSAAVLEAYLDRTIGEAWREAAGAASGGEGGGGPESMDRQDAYEILGLEPGASDSDIRDAHRRLMQKVHPDHGGSNYLASKIKRAKELLLGE